jgi:hypothetical protein
MTLRTFCDKQTFYDIADAECIPARFGQRPTTPQEPSPGIPVHEPGPPSCAGSTPTYSVRVNLAEVPLEAFGPTMTRASPGSIRSVIVRS